MPAGSSSSSRPASPTVSSKPTLRVPRTTNPQSNSATPTDPDAASRGHQRINTNRHTVDILNESLPPQTPTSSSSTGLRGASPPQLKKRQPRPRPQSVDDTYGANKAKSVPPKVTLFDIHQSRWIEDPENRASEKIYLIGEEAPLSAMSGISTEFCWIHHVRDRTMLFEDFVVGLFPHHPSTIPAAAT
jgi:hypothetical protein